MAGVVTRASGREPGLLQRCGGTACPPGTCDHDDQPFLQRSGYSRAQSAMQPAVNQVLRSAGAPLGATTQTIMEPRLGHRFAQLRIHADAEVAEALPAVNASAFTVGRDAVFGANRLSQQEMDHKNPWAKTDSTHEEQGTSRSGRSEKEIVGNHPAHFPRLLRRTIRNQAAQGIRRPKDEELEVGSTRTAAFRSGLDFNWIQVYAKTPVSLAPILTVDSPGDSCEQEADAIADQVTQRSGPQASPRDDPFPSKPLPARVASIVQAKAPNGSAVSNALTRRISSSLGGGIEMDASTQVTMRRSFGTDFSHVRIHTDSEAAQMSSELGAYAFTLGRDIYFGSGMYAPATDAGRRLLAHELTHTIQQGSTTIQRQTEAKEQSEVGLGILNEEGRPEGGALPEGLGVVSEEEVPEAAEVPEPIQGQIQRSTSWAGATVHETRNKAEDSLSGGAPITWQMLNGKMLITEADADSSIKLPAISTGGSGSAWTAKVATVPAQEGADDETVLAPGPWSTVAPKADVGAKFGLAACAGAGNSTFSALGKPSDDAVYKANRRHEDHHVADDKVAFEQTVGKWDKKLEDAKSKVTEYKGTDAGKAEAALWAAMGGKPMEVARAYRNLSFTKGDQYHGTAAGGPMTTSNAKSNADCSTSSIEVTNPS